MSSNRRILEYREQPDMLHAGLRDATIVTTEKQAEVAPIGLLSRLFGGKKKPHPEVITASGKGLPHGVTNAIVYARNVRIEHSPAGPRIYFCRSYDYVALAETLQGADGGAYPSVDQSEISFGTRKIPYGDGHTVRMRVSVNGSVHAHIEAFDVQIPQLAQA